eukprot:Phypoly_transcript_04699.p1 GENE.Phypoly_transcript_04699~~Phypoly_transcript_04699.p1  ORF type:complete len:701 (+),score=99.60 Phypoly_transcript_04699:197-2104(+)
MNNSVNPCDDFYLHSCGNWIANTTLPPSEDAFFKSISTIENNNQLILKSILETQYNNTLQLDGRITALYQSCMDLDAINATGTSPLDDLFSPISLVSDVQSFSEAVGVMHREGVVALFSISAVLDSEDPTLTIAGLSQGGLALPDPSMYSDSAIMSKYVTHITNMFSLTGLSTQDSSLMAKQAVAFESGIASFTVPPDQLTNPFVTYNKINLTGLEAIAPNFTWVSYLEAIQYPNITQITVDVPSFYANISAFVQGQTVESMRSYLYWEALHAYATALPGPFLAENFAFFGAFLEGLQEMQPRWQQCVASVDQYMGFLLGQYFVQVAFPGSSEEMASVMIQNIEAMMHLNLETISWMDNITRANAIQKLGMVTNQIGSPNYNLTYEGLEIDTQFFNNSVSASIWNFEYMANQIEQPSNKNLWEMTPPTVNAYYDPTKNGMVFPAGILQNPFFDKSFAAAIYFGGAGVIMGHELTHGFDDSGRNYDGNGVLRNWWQPATSAKFDSLVSCVIEQYDQFEVLPGLYINGNLTQGENIADMGGSKLSYLALQNEIGEANMTAPSVVPGLTNAQLFFIAYAQGWCAVQTPESLRIQVATDPHSTPRYRVLGPLINHPYFAPTFNCPVGSYMNPEHKCSVW